MSGFDLVPVDGGAPVHLPPGETVLGRGPLLGVSDKRVSRHHGLLENLNGQLRLKPTHVNPCFVQSSPDDEDPRSLKKDSWYTLHHGDFISLLPGQFVYEVVAVGGDERTLRNSQALEEEERELPGSPESHVEPANPVRADPGQTVTSSAPSNKEEDDVKTTGNVAPSVTRKRVLPAWMMTTAAASSPTALKKMKAPAAAGEATPTAVSSPERAGLSQEKRLRKRRRRRSDEEEDTRTKTAPSGRLQPAPVRSEVNRSEVSDESDNITMEEEEEGVGVRGQSSSDTNIRMETSEDEMSERQQTTGRTETAGSDAGAVSKPRVRTPCPYGKDCYRKNPLHFQECSHPGDSDYQEEEEAEGEGEGEERPECPYGTDCYRKNPLHRKEFKHTRRPARSTRAVPRRSPADDEDVEDDDSFINDDSEDGDNDEDKDYVPPDSDDSGTEDVRRLQREAQEFLRRRK